MIYDVSCNDVESRTLYTTASRVPIAYRYNTMTQESNSWIVILFFFLHIYSLMSIHR